MYLFIIEVINIFIILKYIKYIRYVLFYIHFILINDKIKEYLFKISIVYKLD